MQLQYRRKRIWCIFAVLVGSLAWTVVDVAQKGMFPSQFPFWLRLIGFVPVIFMIWLTIEIWFDSARQMLANHVLLGSFIPVTLLGLFSVEMPPDGTVIGLLIAVVFISGYYVLLWWIVHWSLKSSKDDFVENNS